MALRAAMLDPDGPVRDHSLCSRRTRRHRRLRVPLIQLTVHVILERSKARWIQNRRSPKNSDFFRQRSIFDNDPTATRTRLHNRIHHDICSSIEHISSLYHRQQGRNSHAQSNSGHAILTDLHTFGVSRVCLPVDQAESDPRLAA